jgi:hypothetical protein
MSEVAGRGSRRRDRESAFRESNGEEFSRMQLRCRSRRRDRAWGGMLGLGGVRCLVVWVRRMLAGRLWTNRRDRKLLGVVMVVVAGPVGH